MRGWVRSGGEPWRVRLRQQLARRMDLPGAASLAVQKDRRGLLEHVSESDAASMIEAHPLDTWQRAAAELAYSCCIDATQVAALTAADFDIEARTVRVGEHLRPLGRCAREAVSAYLGATGNDGFPVAATIQRQVKARLLRQSAAVHMVLRGADPVTVGALLGYESPGSAHRALGPFEALRRARLEVAR
ncbi:MAG: hypothetical protein FJ090_14755 [Deltaproteobacteria bacterium]|nr:hypothetical protein [Deltaproteobacteria bacterium]